MADIDFNALVVRSNHAPKLFRDDTFEQESLALRAVAYSLATDAEQIQAQIEKSNVCLDTLLEPCYFAKKIEQLRVQHWARERTKSEWH